MIKIKFGNLFDAPAPALICHQVNCQGVMGAGVALTFKKMYPNAFNKYIELCNNKSTDELLGTCLFKKAPLGYSCCMFAQNGIRRGACNTNYYAFRECCKEIKFFLTDCDLTHYTVNMPYGIGCGLGGGDWNHIYSIIEEELADFHVILWKLEDKMG